MEAGYSEDRARGAANLARAKDWHAQGRFDEAAREYDTLLAQEPERADVLHQYGVLHYQRGAVAQAEALLRRSIARAPAVRALSDLGAVLAETGRIDEGLTHFEAALRLDPADVQTLVRKGNTLSAQRRHAAALDAFDRVLSISPLVLDALCNRGGALRALGRRDEALQSYDRALVVDPASFESWFNRSLVLRELGRTADALHSVERALSLQPGHAAMLSMRGQCLADLDRSSEALAAFDEAIAAEPNRIDALHHSAIALEHLGRAAEAIGRCERVLSLDARHAPALSCRGNALLRLQRYEAALSSYDLALAIAPDAVEVHCNRGNALRHLKRFGAALAAYDAALARDPRFADAWLNRCGVLQDLHRRDEALSALDRAAALRPAQAIDFFNRGKLHADAGRDEAALNAYGRAIELNPDYVDAHVARAVLYLAQGDFARGWTAYEWRLRDAEGTRHDRAFAQPAWRGDAPLDGRTILIHAEQGYGDTLQFCRYVPRVAALGARVLLEVPRTLHTLMASLPASTQGQDQAQVQVIARGDPLPAFDYQCPLLSLPLALRADAASIPRDTPYLHADPERVRYCAQRLDDALDRAHQAHPTPRPPGPRRPRIGLAWAGNPAHRNDHNRSIGLAQLAPLFDLDVDWISVQKQMSDADEDALDTTPMIRIDDELDDFADTAALMQSLDLVISVDSALAHLAGALDRPVWVVLADPPEWRWQRERADSPWYPRARLFRQNRPGQWHDVIEALGVAIAALEKPH
ncbi:tetratricopeptide repeat protein [Paraburkholderia sp. D15]|uniref:tetratricopeptide repeat protein n=1 Tax=Paraburkholderia sp. D15 TaxID=2880218 RepID=UPI00247AE5B9|nr:tetratricopeptide repeat protein [Paraburkholderia sp. D15]WGS48386.1 tetratricopeptide repeat protein [Paraburkholderia sp. D15]